MSTKMKDRMDPAVSPVVGVLLMLVVTIIIAAVVSGFAGGLVGNEKSAPSAAIDVKADSSSGTITFKHMSGDLLNTGDLEINTYYTNETTGTEYKMVTSKNSDSALIYGGNPEWGTSDMYSRVPYLNDMAKTGGMDKYGAWYGNFTFSNGDIMSTANLTGTAALIGFPIDSNNFKSGEIFEVQIKHVPSGKLVYDKEVAIV